LGILFWLTLMQFFLGLICAGYDGQIGWPNAQTLPWLVLIGLCGVMAHLSLTMALSLAPASFVAPIDFLRLPLVAVVAAVLYAEPVDPWVLAGGAVIFSGIWLNVRSQMRVARADPV
jgi:drug/metabolite transporter (DMT)-like permease